MLKKVLLIISTISIMLLIFWFSCQTGSESGGLSESIMADILRVFIDLDSMSITDQLVVIENYDSYLRAFAHMFVFFLLGLSFSSLLVEYELKNYILISLIFCLVYSISDELHQLIFTANRSGEIVDVVKDFIGSSVAVYTVYKFNKKKYNRTINT
jgi:VanZ family protein